MGGIKGVKMTKDNCQKCSGRKKEGSKYPELCCVCANTFDKWREGKDAWTDYPQKVDDNQGILKLASAVIHQGIKDLSNQHKRYDALSFFRGQSFHCWCSILGYVKTRRLKIKETILEKANVALEEVGV